MHDPPPSASWVPSLEVFDTLHVMTVIIKYLRKTEISSDYLLQRIINVVGGVKCLYEYFGYTKNVL